MDGDLLLDKFQILYLAGALEVERLAFYILIAVSFKSIKNLSSSHFKMC